MEPMNEQVTEQITEQVSTQPTEQVVEEKNDTQTQVTENIQTETLKDSPLEGSGTQVDESEGNVTPTEDKKPVEGKPEVSDEIQKKLDRLAEYEVKDKELTDLRDRLGIKEQVQDNQVFSAQQQLAIVENQAQQEYIRLCNEYGVDYRPDKIDASGRELREKDPKAFYELKFKLEGLNNSVEQKRAEVNNFIEQRDIQLAIARNQEILKASPVMGSIVNHYLQEGCTGADIDQIVKFGNQIMQEAFEMGRQYAKNEKAQVKPAEVLNNTTISQQAPSTPSPTTKLTLADVEKMDIETYKQHQKEIDKLFLG
jgi:hypothetical protein